MSHRIPPSEIDRLKQTVPLLDLCRKYGIEMKRVVSSFFRTLLRRWEFFWGAGLSLIVAAFFLSCLFIF
jgi:hypothetical protein